MADFTPPHDPDTDPPVGPRVDTTPRPLPARIPHKGRSVDLEVLHPRHIPDLWQAAQSDRTEGSWAYMGYGPFATEAALGAFIGGFDAGQQHRRLRGFQATRAHVNALIAASGPDITARARWLVRNNGYAVNAVESWAANTVGDGIKPISKIAETL